MTTFTSFLIFCQVIGAFTGACTAIWGEFAYIRAMRDGEIDVAERAHLRIIAKGLRFGMLTILLSSFGLVVTAFLTQTYPQPALSPEYWTVVALALLITGISWALSHKHVSFAFGSAIVFTGWWFLAYLTMGWLSPLSFGGAVALYVVATGIFYAVLQYVRFLVLDSGQKD